MTDLTGTVAARIEARLRTAFDPDVLEVTDNSAAHAGHAGAPAGGQSHFHVRMRAAAFAGKSRIARQRAVYKALADELSGPIHALELDLSTP